MNLTYNAESSLRGSLAGARTMRLKAASREDIPGGHDDYLLDAPARRRLTRLEAEIRLPWVPLAVRWIDSQPPIDEAAITRYSAAKRQIPRTVTGIAIDPEREAWRGRRRAYERERYAREMAALGTREEREARREALKAAHRTPAQQRKRDYYLKRREEIARRYKERKDGR